MHKHPCLLPVPKPPNCRDIDKLNIKRNKYMLQVASSSTRIKRRSLYSTALFSALSRGNGRYHLAYMEIDVELEYAFFGATVDCPSIRAHGETSRAQTIRRVIVVRMVGTSESHAAETVRIDCILSRLSRVAKSFAHRCQLSKAPKLVAKLRCSRAARSIGGSGVTRKRFLDCAPRIICVGNDVVVIAPRLAHMGLGCNWVG